MSRRAAVNEKQGRHSSYFALVRFAMMTTCLDLAAELLSALIAGHEERAEVREERRGAGGHVKALGGSALATPSRWPRWSRAITHRVQSICSRHHHKMSPFREGGPRRREGREFSEGGINGEGHRFSVRFSGTKNPDGERPAFSKTFYNTNQKPGRATQSSALGEGGCCSLSRPSDDLKRRES